MGGVDGEAQEFVEHVVETVRAFGPVEAKAMFGGWGIYHRGAFFALIAVDALDFKVDDENRPRFAARGLEAFVYPMKDGTTLSMNYHQAPEEALGACRTFVSGNLDYTGLH